MLLNGMIAVAPRVHILLSLVPVIPGLMSAVPSGSKGSPSSLDFDSRLLLVDASTARPQVNSSRERTVTPIIEAVLLGVHVGVLALLVLVMTMLLLLVLLHLLLEDLFKRKQILRVEDLLLVQLLRLLVRQSTSSM